MDVKTRQNCINSFLFLIRFSKKRAKDAFLKGNKVF